MQSEHRLGTFEAIAGSSDEVKAFALHELVDAIDPAGISRPQVISPRVPLPIS